MSEVILKRKEVCERLGVSRITLWRWCRDGLFPAPGGMAGTNFQGWRESMVNAWIDDKFPEHGEDSIH